MRLFPIPVAAFPLAVLTAALICSSRAAAEVQDYPEAWQHPSEGKPVASECKFVLFTLLLSYNYVKYNLQVRQVVFIPFAVVLSGV